MRRASAFHERLDALAADEARWLRSIGARLVVGDIPPLACAAAHAAGLPGDRAGQLHLGLDLRGLPRVAPARIRSHREARRCVCPRRHGAAPADARRLRDDAARSSICRSSRAVPRAHPADTRAQLGLPRDRPLALLSFGGYGLQRIDLGAAAGLTGYTIVVTADVTANRRADEVPSDAGGSRLSVQREAGRRAGALRRRLALRGSRRGGRCRAHQARLRHHRRMRGQRHGDRLHLARPFRRVQTCWFARCPGGCAAGSSRTTTCWPGAGSRRWTRRSRSRRRPRVDRRRRRGASGAESSSITCRGRAHARPYASP